MKKPSPFEIVFLLYVGFVALAMVGTWIDTQRGMIVNEMNVLIQDLGIFILPASLAISYFLLERLFVFPEVQEMPWFGKVCLHGMSLVLIASGLMGGLVTANHFTSEGAVRAETFTLLDSYTKYAGRDWKYASDNSDRFYLVLKKRKTKKTYKLQVREDFYNKVLEEDYKPGILMLKMPVGGLGFWE